MVNGKTSGLNICHMSESRLVFNNDLAFPIPTYIYGLTVQPYGQLVHPEFPQVDKMVVHSHVDRTIIMKSLHQVVYKNMMHRGFVQCMKCLHHSADVR